MVCSIPAKVTVSRPQTERPIDPDVAAAARGKFHGTECSVNVIWSGLPQTLVRARAA